MAFTDNSDIYAAVHEDGVNRVIQHIERQRPSLFNYGTPGIRQNPGLLCEKVDVHPVVIERGNPIVGAAPYLPVIGSGGYVLDYCVQITTAEIDFSPGSLFNLPPQLSPPLGEQRFAFHGAMCAGLGCPRRELVDELRPLPPPSVNAAGIPFDPRQVPIPFGELECFCLDAFIVGGFDFTGPSGDQHLLGSLEGLELVDMTPEGLENSLECYLRLVIQLSLLPRLSIPTIKFVKDLLGLVAVTIEPTPSPPTVANNPALEEDQLKIFLDLTAAPPGPPPPPGPPGPPAVPGVVRPRTRTGPFDIIAAFSEDAVRALFEVVRDEFSFSKSDSAGFGPFSASYTAEAHLEDGTIDLRDDNTIQVKELDIVWDTLELCLGIDLPGFCVGGWCLIPIPFDGCALRLPEICVFDDDPDIGFCLDIGAFIAHEISITVSPLTKYAVNPARLPTMNDWDAKDAGIPNKWQILIDPVSVDVDLLDFADIIGGLLEAALESAIEGLLGFLPGWAQDLILAFFGPIIDLITAIIDLGDDIDEWLTDLLGVSFGLFDFILTLILDHFAEDKPLKEIEDPFPIPGVPGPAGLIPVLIPVEFLGVRVNTDEMILEADIGA